MDIGQRPCALCGEPLERMADDTWAHYFEHVAEHDHAPVLAPIDWCMTCGEEVRWSENGGHCNCWVLLAGFLEQYLGIGFDGSAELAHNLWDDTADREYVWLAKYAEDHIHNDGSPVQVFPRPVWPQCLLCGVPRSEHVSGSHKWRWFQRDDAPLLDRHPDSIMMIDGMEQRTRCGHSLATCHLNRCFQAPGIGAVGVELCDPKPGDEDPVTQWERWVRQRQGSG